MLALVVGKRVCYGFAGAALLPRALGELAMTVSTEQVAAFIAREFPQTKCVIESVGGRHSRVRHPVGPEELRPGGTVAGPVLMAVADVALYVAILGEIGMVTMVVTSSLNINFLRKPPADRPIISECRLIKVGKTLVVGEVFLYSQGLDEPVAHVVGTYAIPAATP